MPNKPQPNFNLDRYLNLPQMFESSIQTTAAQVFVHRTDSKLATFCPFSEGFV
jgi:hypothetical protein